MPQRDTREARPPYGCTIRLSITWTSGAPATAFGPAHPVELRPDRRFIKTAHTS